MKYKRLRLEIIRFVESQGYKVLDTHIYDLGESIFLVVEKDGKKNRLPIRECFYDTDNEGNMTKFHGVADIRMTPWYKNMKNSYAPSMR